LSSINLCGHASRSASAAVGCGWCATTGLAAVVEVWTKTVAETVTREHPTQVVALNPLHNTLYVGATGETGLTVIPL
jgi:hypothetical protein